jgi:PAS domain S-box-containing protein
MTSSDAAKFGRLTAGFFLGCAAIALLTWGCFVLDARLAIVALLYTIVIVQMSTLGSVVPAVALALIAAASLDYFFMVPIFSFEIDSPTDVVVVIAFVSTAVIVANLVKRGRRLAEAAALSDRLQLVIDTIPAVVWSNLPDGSTQFLNQGFRDYSGLTGEQARVTGWLNLLHPEDRAATDWNAAFATGAAFEREARLRAADGSYRRFLLRLAPLVGRQGDIDSWYATSTDIEDLKRTEEALRERETYLREAQAELAHVNRITTAGQLAASIGHEVAQPVAASVTNASAALRWLGTEPPDLAEARAALSRILRDGRRAGDIISRIRALVRREPPRKERFDINDMIREVLALTRSELQRHGIAPQTRLTDGLEPVQGDRVQLQQVVLNLVLNAAEAMSEGGDGPRDLLVASEADRAGGVDIAVSDSGPGLRPEDRDRLFDAFYTTKAGGMGMGLSICRTIVEAHGGRIWVVANDPRGAVFHFTLPGEEQTAAAAQSLVSDAARLNGP